MSITKVQIAAGSMKNQCPSCGEVFRSVSGFDSHRIGKFNSESDPRRCKTKKEIQDSGYSLKEGVWSKEFVLS